MIVVSRSTRGDLVKAHKFLSSGLCALGNRLRDPRCQFLFANDVDDDLVATPATTAHDVSHAVAESVLRDDDDAGEDRANCGAGSQGLGALLGSPDVDAWRGFLCLQCCQRKVSCGG